MLVNIIYKNNNAKSKTADIVFFVDEKYNISSLKKNFSNAEYSYISDLLKISDKQKKILSFKFNSKKTIILVSIKKNIKHFEAENLGATFYENIKNHKQTIYVLNTDTLLNEFKNLIGYFLHGVKLKSYQFEKYKTKKTNKNITLYPIGKNLPNKNSQIKFRSLEEGTFFARDLVSEPGNVLHPDEYAKRINLLKKNGLKVNIYNENKLKKLGMNTLLGVGQGSIRGSYLVTMEWNGLKDK